MSRRCDLCFPQGSAPSLPLNAHWRSSTVSTASHHRSSARFRRLLYMKRFTVPALAAIAWPARSRSRCRTLAAQSRAKAVNVPIIPHEAVPNFFKNPPGIYTGENMGISTDSKGNIYIYHRAGRDAAVPVRSDRQVRAAKSAATTTASRSRTRSASMPRTTSGRSTKAPTCW